MTDEQANILGWEVMPDKETVSCKVFVHAGYEKKEDAPHMRIKMTKTDRMDVTIYKKVLNQFQIIFRGKIANPKDLVSVLPLLDLTV